MVDDLVAFHLISTEMAYATLHITCLVEQLSLFYPRTDMRQLERHVYLGSKADMKARICDVCFTPKADIQRPLAAVCPPQELRLARPDLDKL